MRQLNFRVDPTYDAKIRTHCLNHNISVSDFMRSLVEAAVPGLSTTPRQACDRPPTAPSRQLVPLPVSVRLRRFLDEALTARALTDATGRTHQSTSLAAFIRDATIAQVRQQFDAGGIPVSWEDIEAGEF